MDKIGRNIDEEKRGKLLVLAAFIALAIFVSKITQAESQVGIWRIYLTAFIYFLITFVGLIWAFGFKVKKKSILFLLQPSFLPTGSKDVPRICLLASLPPIL